MSEQRPRLVLLDGTALAFRAFFAIRGLTDSQGRPSGALYGFLASLLKILEEQERHTEDPLHVAVAWDREEPTFRHEMEPEYKATRERMDEDLIQQLPWMQEALPLLGIASLEVSGFEADDIIATLAARAAERGWEVAVCAGDKDFAQLVRDNVRLYPPSRSGELQDPLGPKEVEERYGVPPERMIDWQALVGDSSDNIPGVPGVGPKKATLLLQKYGDLETVLERGPREEKGKLRENLEAHAGTARAARELVTLRTDVPLPDLEELRRRPPDREALLAFCHEHSLNTLADRFAGGGPDPEPEDRDYRTADTPERLAELLDGLARAERFALDTETTGLDPHRADLVGLSFSWEEGVAWYLPCNLDPPLRTAGGDAPLQALAPILGDPARGKVAQNFKYDAHVLERHGAPVRGLVFDTMVAHFLADPLSRHSLDAMALQYLGLRKIATEEVIGKGRQQITMDRVPVEVVARYACEDAEVTWRLVPHLERALDETGSRRLFEEVELPLVTVLQRMEARGVRVDPGRLEELAQRLSARAEALEKRIHELAGEPFNLNSPKQLGPVLFEKLRIQDQAGVRRVARTKTGYRTDAATLERYRGIEIVDLLLEWRQLTKLIGTYVTTLPRYIHPETGCIHTSFHQTVAATGRLSSSDPNLQNIPIRSEAGREIRRAFVPLHPDWVMISADYSQIELRVVAHLSGDPALCRAFEEDADVHAATAALVFGVAEDEVTPDMRARAKAINFGILYGMGPQRLARDLGISFSEARDFIDGYFAALPGVRAWLDRTLEEARRSGEVRTLLGRRRPIPELLSSDPRVRSGAENMAVNTPVQGSAADIIKLAMLRVDRALEEEGLRARMILQVHDELLFDAPEEEREAVCALARREMEGVTELRVPLKVDLGWGPDWASAH